MIAAPTSTKMVVVTMGAREADLLTEILSDAERSNNHIVGYETVQELHSALAAATAVADAELNEDQLRYGLTVAARTSARLAPDAINEMFDALEERIRARVLREAAEQIRTDMGRQGAGGQYDMGMKRAKFLIDPDKAAS